MLNFSRPDSSDFTMQGLQDFVHNSETYGRQRRILGVTGLTGTTTDTPSQASGPVAPTVAFAVAVDCWAGEYMTLAPLVSTAEDDPESGWWTL